jgi:hypothetical protein
MAEPFILMEAGNLETSGRIMGIGISIKKGWLAFNNHGVVRAWKVPNFSGSPIPFHSLLKP